MIVYKSSLSGCACAQQIIFNSESLTVQFVYMCRVNGVGQRAPTVTNRRLFKSCASKQQQRLLLHFSGAGQHLYSNGHPMHALIHPNYKSMPLRATCVQLYYIALYIHSKLLHAPTYIKLLYAGARPCTDNYII